MMDIIDNSPQPEASTRRKCLVELVINLALVMDGKRLAYYDDKEFSKEMSDYLAVQIKNKFPTLTIHNINGECYAPLIFLTSNLRRIFQVMSEAKRNNKDALGEVLGYKYTLEDWSSPDIPKYNIEYYSTKGTEKYRIAGFLCPISHFTTEVREGVKNEVLSFRETLSPLGYEVNASIRLWTGNRMQEVIEERIVI